MAVSVTPGTSSVFLGAQQQFNVTVTNTTNTAVTWSVNGVASGNMAVGTIAAAGLYTAPQILPSPASVTIRATSQADPTKSASATATLMSDVAVSLSPAPAPVLLGAMQQFTATVNGSGNPDLSVIWSLSGSGCNGEACGRVDTFGRYTAPGILPSPASVTLTATSVADGAKFSNASVMLSSGSLSVEISAPAGVDNGTQAVIQASVIADPGSSPSILLNYAISGPGCGGGACGSITNAGLYTAPPLAPSPNLVTFTATSVADPSRSAMASTTINTLILVTISPTLTNVELEATRDFTAAVSGTADTRVTWDVNGIVGGDATVGTISNPAVGPTSPTTYTAPVNLPAGGQVTVRATSVASLSDPGGTKTASTTALLFSNIVVVLSPSSTTRAVNHRETFSASVTNGMGGPMNKNVTWSVNGVAGGNTTLGQICVLGFDPCQPITGSVAPGMVEYRAPAVVPAGGIVTVTATSEADPAHFGSALVNLLATVQVSVSPANSTVAPATSQPVTASVLGTSDQRVTWSVNGIVNGDDTVGRICVTGFSPCTAPSGPLAGNVVYSAPAAAPMNPTVALRATSAEDPAQFAEGTITIATGPQIRTLVPSSFTAVPLNGFIVKVQGLSFSPSSPGPASEVLVNGSPRTTSCISATECSINIGDSDTAVAGDKLIQVRDPDGTLSNQVIFRVVPPDTTEDVIALTGGSPEAANKDILVVDSPVSGAGTSAYNLTLLGVFSGNSCNAVGTLITLTRPAPGAPPLEVRICVGGNRLSPIHSFRLSGPEPNDIALSIPPGQPANPLTVELRLTLTSATLPGLRTLFIENENREKSAATGAIEVK